MLGIMVLYHFLNSIFPGHLGTRLRFYKKLGYPLSLSNPKTFCEKVHWRKAYDRNPLFTLCADKLKARDYVREKIGEQYLIPLLYAGETIDADQLRALEGEFVVKPNHRSGGVYIVETTKPVDFDAIVSSIRKLLKKPYAVKNGEWWYEAIPRRVMVERFLRGSQGQWAEDYKFYVFNSSDHSEIVLQVEYGKNSNSPRYSVTWYDENLEVLPFETAHKSEFRPFVRPKNYEKMLELAKKLSCDFDFCRVDFYNVDGNIYFGELTFAPGNGVVLFKPQEFDLWLGEKWAFPESGASA
jgi:hypothetical protein